MKKLAILGYHKVGPPPPGGWETWYYVPEGTFVAHLDTLRDNGWGVLDAAALLRGLEDPNTLPDRAALITFDDGYRSNLEFAAPHLVRFGFPAVMFVPTQFIGRTNTFDGGAEPEERICDWSDLRELEHCGFSIQSHSVFHPQLSRLGPAAVEEELVRSKAALETGLGKPVSLFAYPYGDVGTDLHTTRRLLQQSGYRAACVYGGGPNAVPVADAYYLQRLALGPDTDLNADLQGRRP